MEPQNTELPLGYSTKLTPFEKVLVLRMLRPDKVGYRAKHIVIVITLCEILLPSLFPAPLP